MKETKENDMNTELFWNLVYKATLSDELKHYIAKKFGREELLNILVWQKVWYRTHKEVI